MGGSLKPSSQAWFFLAGFAPGTQPDYKVCSQRDCQVGYTKESTSDS